MQKTNTTNLIIFAFKGTHAEKVLAQIPFDVKVLVPSDANQIPRVVHTLLKAQPRYILGLGQYSGKDTNMLKIETFCSNKFRNTVRGPKYEEIHLDNFLMQGKHSRYAKSMGNSYCNLISYLIMKQIQEMDTHARYSFVHIPKSFDPQSAVEEISEMLESAMPISEPIIGGIYRHPEQFDTHYISSIETQRLSESVTRSLKRISKKDRAPIAIPPPLFSR